MYKAPIELLVGSMYTEFVNQQEENIYRAVQNYGVDVNKEELVRALAYDRNQYREGYFNAITDVLEKLDELLKVYPYKVSGEYETYSDYNQGWQDALYRASDEVEAIEVR